MSELALRMLDLLRTSDPEMKIGVLVAGLESQTVRAKCRWCAEPISRFRVSDDSPWLHDDPSRTRGCHAASFDRDGRGGWNNALPKDKRAAPKPNSVRDHRGRSLDPA